MKKLTLVYLIRKNEICLALKKRGFGEGNFNGYGGKLEAGETFLQAAVREVYEESTCVVQEEDLEQVADITFVFSREKMRVRAYFVETWEGEPEETEEMNPQWFLKAEVPYEKMWSDDEHWLPSVFKGKKLKGIVWFKEDGTSIKRMQWEEVAGFA